MEIRQTVADQVARISLEGRFDFASHREFRDATEGLLAQDAITTLTIDLGAVSYLDSSALGMLLMLRDKARAAKRDVSLANAHGPVRQVLEVANFQKLFRID
ncbi:MAG: STAS domain-containing protein [Gammaproteobacteria bacterium]|jgi:HptB-dependent secretion and biofilm anti anti-sigma factor|nr:STAS domain-containing protein [Gammaproteobacteria bacterium]MBU0770690.1 STAS domain-containing protein [Gammaproteobacteria bacterium]MBU0857564.1 STAS domain-containing protein [Gammaproteobacteria bacterium]MBU1848692.1 STAS domain-containing protein [Gammaproteobacteria bacterium]